MVQAVVAVVLGGFALVGLPFVLVGVSLLRRGRRRLRTRATLGNTPLLTVADIQAGDRAKLSGHASPDSTAPDDGTAVGTDTSLNGHDSVGAPTGTFAAGISGAPAFAARYEVTERRPDGEGGTDARVVYEGTRVIPFRLVDETGSVVVDASSVAVDPGDDHHESRRVGKGETPPANIESFIGETSGLDPASPGQSVGPVNVGGRIRNYAEWTIRPDDDVVVVGPVDRDPDAPWGDSLVVRPASDGTDLVTNRSLSEQDSHSAVLAAGYLLAGAVLTIGPLAVLGYMLLELGVL